MSREIFGFSPISEVKTLSIGDKVSVGEGYSWTVVNRHVLSKELIRIELSNGIDGAGRQDVSLLFSTNGSEEFISIRIEKDSISESISFKICKLVRVGTVFDKMKPKRFNSGGSHEGKRYRR